MIRLSYMTDTAQSSASSASGVTNTAQQSVQQVPKQQDESPTANTQTVPQQPIGTPHKEFAPIVGTVAEYVTPTETEPVVSAELKEHGVEVSPGGKQPEIHPLAGEVGLVKAKESVSVPTDTTGMVQLPLAQADAFTIKKTRPVADSVRWLAELVLEQIKKAHKQLMKQ